MQLLFKTHCFNLFKGSGCFFLLLFLCSILLSHRSKPLSNAVFVTLTQFMGSDTQWIVGNIDLAKVAPFISLAYPILKRTKRLVKQLASFTVQIVYIEESKTTRYATRTKLKRKFASYATFYFKFLFD